MNKRNLVQIGLITLAVGITALLVVAGSSQPGGNDGGADPPVRDDYDPALRVFWDILEGQPAPPINTLEDWMGTAARSWEDLRGSVVLVDVWGTWCGPCVAAIPHLKELHEKYSKDGLVILGVHSSMGAEHMKGFVRSRKLPWAFAADKNEEFAKALGIRYWPCYFLVDDQGVMRVAGVHPYGLEHVIKTVLQQKQAEEQKRQEQQAGDEPPDIGSSEDDEG